MIVASKAMHEFVKSKKKKKINVYSFFPVDRASCACHSMVTEWKDSLALLNEKDRKQKIVETGSLQCPRDKSNMNRYELVCNGCGEIMGYCWATDETLSDWCDFHYAQWTDGDYWFGCIAPNISPITNQLTLLCSCGNDSRDFRANGSLAPKEAAFREKNARIGRKFGQENSRFGTRKIEKKPLKIKQELI